MPSRVVTYVLGFAFVSGAAAAESLKEVKEDALREFARLDADTSGFLESEEISKGVAGSTHTVNDVLNDFDGDDDGKLSYDEVLGIASALDKETSHGEQAASFLTKSSAVDDDASDEFDRLDHDKRGSLQAKEITDGPVGIGETVRQASNAFRQLDGDRSGFLEESEIREGLRGSAHSVDEVLRVFDRDQDQRLSENEVRAIAIRSANEDKSALFESDHQSLGQQARAEFTRLDRDHSGFLEAGEVEAGLVGSGKTLAEVLDTYDNDHDGTLSYQEVFDIAKNAQNGNDRQWSDSDSQSMYQDRPSMNIDEVDEEGGRRQFDNLDHDQSGFLEDRPSMSNDEIEEEVRREFYNLDRDQSGFVEEDEVHEGLAGSAHSASEVLNVYDSDHDGRLSYAEILALARKASDKSGGRGVA